MKRLSRSFFQQDTLTVAQSLLGKVLMIDGCGGRINEVEAYIGQDDLACHAACGLTERNRTMFGEAGHLYVYFTYGMHYCANIVTEKEGFPAAVLIRAIEPMIGIEKMIERRGIGKPIANGPAKLCQALAITRQSHDGKDLCDGADCFVYDDHFIPAKILSSARIGIRLGREKQWRFFYDCAPLSTVL